jgi:hypothetical protein
VSSLRQLVPERLIDRHVRGRRKVERSQQVVGRDQREVMFALGLPDGRVLRRATGQADASASGEDRLSPV